MRPQPHHVAPLLAVALLTFTPAALAETTSPGRNSVFASQSGDLDSIQLLGTITKAKRGQVLKIDVFYTLYGGSCGGASQACISLVTVNTLPVQPTQNGGCIPCSSLGCTVSGSFWFDPEAEGQVGEPLDVRVVLADGGTQCLRTMFGSMAAEMVRK
jgi:hypothetical protein